MFRPLNNRIVVRPEEKPTETASGLLLAEKVVEKPVIGVVVVGGEVVGQGKITKVEVGDRVLFSKFGYDEVTLDGELHYVVSESCILGIF